MGPVHAHVNPSELKPMQLDSRVPLELETACNAVQIARLVGADKPAVETFQKAVQGLQNAEGYLRGKQGKKPIGTVAREAAQMAEDARIITLKKIEEERLANERAAAAEREARAPKRKPKPRARRRAQAEADEKAEGGAQGAAPRPNEPPRSPRQNVLNEKLRQRGQPRRLKPKRVKRETAVLLSRRTGRNRARWQGESRSGSSTCHRDGSAGGGTGRG